jgi:DnaD/phage-associated family protein
VGHYKVTDIKNEEFYMLPKSLFENEDLKGITPSAKIIYAILKDRMWLSWANKWCDDNGDIYFLFNQSSLAEVSCLSVKTIQRSMTELREHGLIEIRRQGQGKPSKLYINKLPQCPIKKGQNDLSEQVKMTFLEESKCPTNNTNINNTKEVVEEDATTTLPAINQEVLNTYQDNIHPISSKRELEMLADDIERYGNKWVIDAIDRAVLRNKRSLGYIEGILRNWETNGFDDGEKKQEEDPDGFRQPLITEDPQYIEMQRIREELRQIGVDA